MGDGDRSGQQIGNYRLEKLLGSGGFADVYLGKHIYLDSPAAIKLLRANLAHEEVERFRLEARTLVNLVHPHIVRVLDFGIESSTPFLVMDYAPNGTLRQRHPRGEKLPLATVIAYVKQIAEALQYAHNEKVIHRDIKPENILLGRQNEILISDFGIAIVFQSTRTHLTREMTGTVTYMAPEQIQSRPRPASDQYSLAVIVYEWLSGEPPFSGVFTEIAIKHITVPPPLLREKIPSLSPEVEQVVLAALAKDPAQRFDSVRSFAVALEQASKGERVALPGSFHPAEVPAVRAAPLTPLPPVASPGPVQSRVRSDDVQYTEAATQLASPAGYSATMPVNAQQSSQPVPRAGSYNPATPILPLQDLPALPEQSGTERKGMSRRVALIAGLSAVGVAAVGGTTWALISHSPQQTTGGTHTPGATTSLSKTPAPSPIPGLLAQDTFNRPDQTFWGTTASGLAWGGDANKLNDFSISGHTGVVYRTVAGRQLYTAVLGAVHADAEVTVTALLTLFNPSHIGLVLRYTDDNNYYKVFVDGNNLNMLRRLGGNNRGLHSVPFTAQANTAYTVRFRVVGSTLRAKVWQATDTEPAHWMITAQDGMFQSGLGGLRPQLDQNVSLHVTLFQETRATGF